MSDSWLWHYARVSMKYHVTIGRNRGNHGSPPSSHGGRDTQEISLAFPHATVQWEDEGVYEPHTQFSTRHRNCLHLDLGLYSLSCIKSQCLALSQLFGKTTDFVRCNISASRFLLFLLHHTVMNTNFHSKKRRLFLLSWALWPQDSARQL